MLLFHIVIMVIEAFVQSVNQSIETFMEEIMVQVAEPFKDGFLNFSVGSEKATCQVLLQLPEEMKSLGARSRLQRGRSNVIVDIQRSCFRDTELAP
ncbi:hypothetical protein AVEN_4279-1 [Araneus ventricosus]|uniref:Uncharacterized protein n=1 Tax=Araneus ventricosus TaxID=182803 RepID=A0A4Y2L3I5_ARAVE|nr:hypothetical protein AVEN_4279-1 [Araneus ventricosus]